MIETTEDKTEKKNVPFSHDLKPEELKKMNSLINLRKRAKELILNATTDPLV